jgi:hypothetical protein
MGVREAPMLWILRLAVPIPEPAGLAMVRAQAAFIGDGTAAEVTSLD